MRTYTHIAGALVFFLSFAYLMNLNNLYWGVFTAAWMSLFPDVLDRLLRKHRGYGHSLFWLFPFILLALFLWNLTIASAIATGIISHAVLDILTTHGSPILYPISKVNFVVLNKKRRIKTGTYQDKTVFITLIFLLIPMLTFSIGYTHMDSFPYLNLLFPHSTNNQDNSLDNVNGINSNQNLNIQLPRPEKNVNGTITVKKINVNETQINYNYI
jgi:inner membrane protein